MEIPVDVELEDDEPTGVIARHLVSAIGTTHPGRRRDHNEDAFRVLNDELFIVADGMGGYAAGEVASQMAVDVITAAIETRHFGGEAVEGMPRRAQEVVRAIQTANHTIYEHAQSEPSLTGMGTTLVVARFSPSRGRVFVAHVGDSRCYRLRDGIITQLTVDHTLSAAGIDGPAGDRLIRAVGVADDVEVDLRIDHPQPGDHYLLCSDGLSKMVPDEAILRIVRESPDLTSAIRDLIEEANARGGKDNVSAILIRVDEIDFDAPPSSAPPAR